jgi:hypothetical protein
MLSIGSGFFIRNNLVVTNLHVVAGAQSGTVKVNGSSRSVVIEGFVAVDEKHDLAIIQTPAVVTPIVQLSVDDNIQIGDQVYVAGNPEGLEGTFSQGIISAIRETREGRILQITAPISPGSSGGPVLSQNGAIVGVAFATLRQGQNLNFAIPSSHVRELISMVQPLRSLATLTKGSESKTAIVERAQGSVKALNFSWTRGTTNWYSFVLRNYGDETVRNISYVIIFYGKDGLPIHSNVLRYSGEILGHLAKTFSSPSPEAGGFDGLHQTSKVDIRVLNYESVP